MTHKFVPVKVLFDEWDKDSEFRAAYDALEESSHSPPQSSVRGPMPTSARPNSPNA